MLCSTSPLCSPPTPGYCEVRPVRRDPPHDDLGSWPDDLETFTVGDYTPAVMPPILMTSARCPQPGLDPTNSGLRLNTYDSSPRIADAWARCPEVLDVDTRARHDPAEPREPMGSGLDSVTSDLWTRWLSPRPWEHGCHCSKG